MRTEELKAGEEYVLSAEIFSEEHKALVRHLAGLGFEVGLSPKGLVIDFADTDRLLAALEAAERFGSISPA